MKKRMFMLLTAISCLLAVNAQAMSLKKNEFRIAVQDNVDQPVRLAAQTLARDVNKVMEFTPEIGAPTGSGVEICIVQDDKPGAADLLTTKKPLDDFESHRVFADASHNRIYLYGKDMRGTIYAIYTFAEKILGVPPLWYWCSWVPERYETITVPNDYDEFFSSPRVRYRAWFPNDTDLFIPWLKDNTSHKEAWLETILRLKLNCVEAEGGVRFDGTIGLDDDCMRIQRFGLVMTSHHHTPLAGGFVHWNEYWNNVKKTTAPELTIATEEGKKNIYEFWQHCIDCVNKANLEYIWLIGFRGSGDHAWWESGDKGIKVSGDPGDDKTRADIINAMTQKMYDMVKASTGESNPFVRMTFYNELSNLLAKGYLKPPSASNVLWTYVCARRDHYPAQDLRNHTNNNVKVGLYMNFQFTSTGSHLAPAEGPWKMEYNYRYAMSKAPLQFSVVNMGNLREYMMEASANASMLWDWDNYKTDNFLVKYCAMYFGKEHARDIAQLYRDYYYSYWNQHKSDFQNMPRQYVFQDLRYAQAFSDIRNNFGNGKINFFDNGRFNIGNHDNELNELISGMGKSAKCFTDVLYRADALKGKLEPRYRTYFNDNFLQYARFMASMSQSLYHFAYASKNQTDVEGHGGAAIGMYTQGQRALYQAQHGEFSNWINNVSGAKFGIGYRYGHITNKVQMANCTFNAGYKNGNIYTYKERPGAGVYDILIKYTGNSDKWINVKVGDTSYGDLFCPKGGSTKAVSEPGGYLIVTARFEDGDNMITISGNDMPAVDGIRIISSGSQSADAPTFDAISPDDGLDLSWNILDGSGTLASLDDSKFYLYNVGQKKYIKTGGALKQPDSPELVAKEEATTQILTENANGTYTIADQDWPAGWGVQGRNTVYISMNGSAKTNSWGTNYTPVWELVPTGDADGSVYIEYTWGTWNKGKVDIDNPSGNTYLLTYAKYDQSTSGWSDAAKNDVASHLVFGGLKSNALTYGANAKWILVAQNDPTAIMVQQAYADTNKAIYSLSGQKVASNVAQIQSLPKGVYIAKGKKTIIM